MPSTPVCPAHYDSMCRYNNSVVSPPKKMYGWGSGIDCSVAERAEARTPALLRSPQHGHILSPHQLGRYCYTPLTLLAN